MKDTDGPRTGPDRFGADGVPPHAGSSRAPADDAAPSFLQDAGAVVASAVAERPLTSILVATGFATLGLLRADDVVSTCPAWWVLLLVFVVAAAGAALVRGGCAGTALCPCLVALGLTAGASSQMTTASLVTMTVGAAAAYLLLRGPAWVLRSVGATALTAGLIALAALERWTVPERLRIAGYYADVTDLRLVSLLGEVAMLVGAALLVQAVRARIAALVLIGTALLLAADYTAAFGGFLLWARSSLMTTATVALLAAAVRASRPTPDGAVACGRLSARLQRHAWLAGAAVLCAVPGASRWSGLLPNVDAAFVEPQESAYRPTGIPWDYAMRGVAAAAAAAICARLRGGAPLLRTLATGAFVTLVIGVDTWIGEPRAVSDLGFAAEELMRLGGVAVACIAGAAVAAYAPAWRRGVVLVGIAGMTIAGTTIAGVGLSNWAAYRNDRPFWIDVPPPQGPLWASGAAWGAAATLVAVARPRWAWAILAVVACAFANELVVQGILATTLREPPPLRFNFVAVLVACFYTLTLTVVVRAFCSWTPVPETHPIHNDFDVLGRSR